MCAPCCLWLACARWQPRVVATSPTAVHSRSRASPLTNQLGSRAGWPRHGGVRRTSAMGAAEWSGVSGEHSSLWASRIQFVPDATAAVSDLGPKKPQASRGVEQQGHQQCMNEGEPLWRIDARTVTSLRRRLLPRRRTCRRTSTRRRRPPVRCRHPGRPAPRPGVLPPPALRRRCRCRRTPNRRLGGR